MLIGGRLIGAVSIAGDDPVLLEEETLSIARAMADQLAVALQHAADRAALEERESRLGSAPRGVAQRDPRGRRCRARPVREPRRPPAVRARRTARSPGRATTPSCPSAAAAVPPRAHMRGWFGRPGPRVAAPASTRRPAASTARRSRSTCCSPGSRPPARCSRSRPSSTCPSGRCSRRGCARPSGSRCSASSPASSPTTCATTSRPSPGPPSSSAADLRARTTPARRTSPSSSGRPRTRST